MGICTSTPDSIIIDKIQRGRQSSQYNINDINYILNRFNNRLNDTMTVHDITILQSEFENHFTSDLENYENNDIMNMYLKLFKKKNDLIQNNVDNLLNFDLLNNISSGITVIKKHNNYVDSDIIFMNRYMINMIGYDSFEIRNINGLISLLFTDYNNAILRFVEHNKNIKKNIKINIKTKNGLIKTINFYGFIDDQYLYWFFNEEESCNREYNEPIENVEFIDNYTDKLEELNIYENFLNEINHNHLFCITTFTNFIKVSKNWNILSGWSDEILLKNKIINFIHPSDVKKFKNAFLDIYSDNNNYVNLKTKFVSLNNIEENIIDNEDSNIFFDEYNYKKIHNKNAKYITILWNIKMYKDKLYCLNIVENDYNTLSNEKVNMENIYSSMKNKFIGLINSINSINTVDKFDSDKLDIDLIDIDLIDAEIMRIYTKQMLKRYLHIKNNIEGLSTEITKLNTYYKIEDESKNKQDISYYEIIRYISKSDKKNISGCINIIIVDDVETNLIIMKRGLNKILCDMDYTGNINIEKYTDPIEVLDKEINYDLCLVDYMMPSMYGPDLVRHLRKKEDGDIPIIIGLTGTMKLSKINDAVDSGMDAYLTKPINNENMGKIIKHYFTFI